MNAQTTTQDETVTLTDRVEYVTKQAIWSIQSTASELHRKLFQVRADADRALEMMQAGQQVYGAYGYGPLGLQGPADIAALTAKLQDSVSLALQLGATQEAVEAAYAAGVARS